MSDDPFVGIWELDPEQCDYQMGEPPRQALYTIQKGVAGYRVIISWTTAEGMNRNAVYETIPDGSVHVDEETGLEIITTRVDEHTLDTSARRSGQLINQARRTLTENGQAMIVTQTGWTAEGEEYTNRAVYHYVGQA
ncbi:MAG: hypothetical protein GYB64_13920 [Chloroflexi bacterium]|nr:hypothetical protein [Chloroflexota bacterium]